MSISCDGFVVQRSDGVTCVPDPGGVLLQQNSPRYVEWCRKLGQWLIMAFDEDGKYKGKEFILEKLPDGYELRDHPRAASGNEDVKKRTTSDIYLHGYSKNPAHKFRSPAEFFPHLVWLASGLPDPSICVCKYCSFGKGTDASDQNSRVTIDEAKVGHAFKGPSVPPTPSVLTGEQQFDSKPKGLYLYRPGELVWFNKNVSTWGLAVIAIRQLKDRIPHYFIQPLSHPLQHPDPEFKEESHLRPWLAWSVPALGNQNLQNANYNQVPWEQILQHYPTDPVVDGSILAAAAIDASYSLFEQDTKALSNTGEKFYKGMYLGAEKIWAGEPVRLRGPTNGVYVMVIKKIVLPPASFPAAAEVVLYGDVYMITKMPTPIKNRDIPARMEEDLDFRNKVEQAAQKGLWNDWRIVEPNAKRGLGDVKGRWYESKRLLPILQGEQTFNENVRNHVVGDCGMWMNGRGDIKVTDVRQNDRRSTFGRAVPAQFTIHQGLDDGMTTA